MINFAFIFIIFWIATRTCLNLPLLFHRKKRDQWLLSQSGIWNTTNSSEFRHRFQQGAALIHFLNHKRNPRLVTLRIYILSKVADQKMQDPWHLYVMSCTVLFSFKSVSQVLRISKTYIRVYNYTIRFLGMFEGRRLL